MKERVCQTGRAGCPQPAVSQWVTHAARWGHRALPAQFLLLCLLTLAFCFRAHAQSYSLDWFTFDGGGGTSTGGVFTVSVTRAVW